MIDLLLRDVVTSGATEPVSVAVDDGRILAVGADLDYPARMEVEGQGHYLSPGFVESHLHLDIALSNDAGQPSRPEAFVSMAGLNAAIESRRRSFIYEEIVRRASAALELGLRHGTTALRAHCHLDTDIGLRHIQALQEVKESFRDAVTLQIVAFPQQGLLRHPATFDLFHEAFRCGADIVGAAANIESERPFQEHIDAAFRVALELDRDIDIHADLPLKPSVALDDLEVVHIARRTLEYGYQGRVTVGHACTLDSATPEVAAEAIELIKEADISVISQPDLYRLGREDTQHVRRGLTRVKEMLAAGVLVLFNAPSASAAIAGQVEKLRVFRAGKLRACTQRSQTKTYLA